MTPPHRVTRTVTALALTLAGCRGDGGGASSSSAPPLSSAGGAVTASLVLAPGASASAATSGARVKVDALAMKLHRADLCLFATLGLRHLREAYLASLRGTAPGPGRIPSFDRASHVDHERQARMCAPGTWNKEPAIPALDEPMGVIGPLMVDLGEEIEEGSEYYALKQHERDAFKAGKAHHDKLVPLFAKMDEAQAALAAGIDAYRVAHPVDLTKLDEGERATTLVLDAGRALVVALVAKAPEGVVRPLLGATDVAATSAVERSAARADDPWSRCGPAIGAFRAAATAAAKGASSDTLLATTDSFARLVEVAHLARATALLAKSKAD